MTKKSYVRPCIVAGEMDATELICTSLGVTSDIGIDYGGVDESGTVTVESRRNTMWNDND
jgi:hypothetical protein